MLSLKFSHLKESHAEKVIKGRSLKVNTNPPQDGISALHDVNERLEEEEPLSYS